MTDRGRKMNYMDVLIIGATGYVGTAIDESLTARGHRTVGVARSDMARYKLQARGTALVRADAAKPQSLIEPARKADAVVYCLQVTDADASSVDRNALRAVARALAGTEKTFVYTSTARVYGSTGSVTANEDSQPNPPYLAARRLELERMTLNMTKIGIRGVVVRPGALDSRPGIRSSRWSPVSEAASSTRTPLPARLSPNRSWSGQPTTS